MSGRLIILPKKSYNPWKPENVERVLRDERLERERRAQLEEADRKKQSEDRVELLKDKKRKRDRSQGDGAHQGVSGKDAALEHVNLFADEERAMMEKAASGAKGNARADADKKGSSTGIMPVYLGGEEAARRKGETAVPFYLRPSSHDDDIDDANGAKFKQEAEAMRVRKDERLKKKMDPMQEFSTRHADSKSSNVESPSISVKEAIEHDGVERRRKRHRRKRRDSYTSSSSSSESDSSSSSSSSGEDDDSRRRKRKRRRRWRRKCDDVKSKRRSSSKKDRRHRRDKKRRCSRRKEDTAQQSHATMLSIDELRRRREQREQSEAERSFMARLEDQSLSGAAGRNHKYQDQYNPSLSRH
jgi:hypothetical protein